MPFNPFDGYYTGEDNKHGDAIAQAYDEEASLSNDNKNGDGLRPTATSYVQDFRDRLAAMPSHDNILAAMEGQQDSLNNHTTQSSFNGPNTTGAQSNPLKRPAPEDSPLREGARETEIVRNSQLKLRKLQESVQQRAQEKQQLGPSYKELSQQYQDLKSFLVCVAEEFESHVREQFRLEDRVEALEAKTKEQDEKLKGQDEKLKEQEDKLKKHEEDKAAREEEVTKQIEAVRDQANKDVVGIYEVFKIYEGDAKKSQESLKAIQDSLAGLHLHESGNQGFRGVPTGPRGDHQQNDNEPRSNNGSGRRGPRRGRRGGFHGGRGHGNMSGPPRAAYRGHG